MRKTARSFQMHGDPVQGVTVNVRGWVDDVPGTGTWLRRDLHHAVDGNSYTMMKVSSSALLLLTHCPDPFQRPALEPKIAHRERTPWSSLRSGGARAAGAAGR